MQILEISHCETFHLMGSASTNANNCRLHPWTGTHFTVSCEISHTQGQGSRDLSQALPSLSLRNLVCWKLLKHWGCCPQPQTGTPHPCILCRVDASSVLALSMHHACLADVLNDSASNLKPSQEHAELAVHRNLCAVCPGPYRRVLPPGQQHRPHCSAGMPAKKQLPAPCLRPACAPPYCRVSGCFISHRPPIPVTS